MAIKIKNGIGILFVFLLTIGFMYFLHNTVPLYKYPELFVSPLLSELALIFSNSIFIILINLIGLVLLAMVVTISLNSIRNIVLWSVLTVISISVMLFIQDFDQYRINKMQLRYNELSLIYPSFEKSSIAEQFQNAISNKDPKTFVSLLENEDSIRQTTPEQLNSILRIAIDVVPEIKNDVLLALNDNYFTKEEYLNLSQLILEKIKNKELNNEQLAILTTLR